MSHVEVFYDTIIKDYVYIITSPLGTVTINVKGKSKPLGVCYSIPDNYVKKAEYDA